MNSVLICEHQIEIGKLKHFFQVYCLISTPLIFSLESPCNDNFQ